MKLTDETAVIPENGHYFVAMGAALASKNLPATGFQDLIDRLPSLDQEREPEIQRLAPLFRPRRFGEFQAPA